MENRIAIIGAGLAAASAAETLREEGFDGPITLIGDEPVRPYERPPLSKGVLFDDKDPDEAFVHPADFYDDNDIELLRGRRADELDTEARTVTTNQGETIRFEKALIATGASPQRLDVPGAGLQGVTAFRTRADAMELGERLDADAPLVVIGAGWIGCEVAAAARRRGREVTLIERAGVPLEAPIGRRFGEVFRDLHADHGVAFVGDAEVEEIEGSAHAQRVRLADGRAFECADVVIGIGVRPRTELALAGGLGVNDGIVVDARLETTSPGIHAAGDVANAWHPFYKRRLRVEHWAVAKRQGAVAARAMCGQDVVYDRLPYFFTDQYDLGMEFTGIPDLADDVVVRGELDQREFIAFWRKDGVVVAGMNVNVWDVAEDIERLILSGTAVEASALADPDTPLGTLIPRDQEAA